MNNSNYSLESTYCTRDYTLSEASSGCVLLEANEWDQSKQTYRRVTLRLSKEEAEILALSLFESAAVLLQK